MFKKSKKGELIELMVMELIMAVLIFYFISTNLNVVMQEEYVNTLYFSRNVVSTIDTIQVINGNIFVELLQFYDFEYFLHPLKKDNRINFYYMAQDSDSKKFEMSNFYTSSKNYFFEFKEEPIYVNQFKLQKKGKTIYFGELENTLYESNNEEITFLIYINTMGVNYENLVFLNDIKKGFGSSANEFLREKIENANLILDFSFFDDVTNSKIISITYAESELESQAKKISENIDVVFSENDFSTTTSLNSNLNSVMKEEYKKIFIKIPKSIKEVDSNAYFNLGNVIGSTFT